MDKFPLGQQLETIDYTAREDLSVDNLESVLIHRIPTQRESATCSPFNSVKELLTPEELVRRERALEILSRKRRMPAPVNIFLN